MIAGLALYLVLVAPPIAAWLERTMAGHMLLQIPLLALAGGLGARGIFGRHGAGLAGFNAAGIAGLLIAVFVAAVWMLPRTLDAALRGRASPGLQRGKSRSPRRRRERPAAAAASSALAGHRSGAGRW